MHSDDDLQIDFHDDPPPPKGKDSWPDVDVLRTPKPPLPPPQPRGFGLGMAVVWCLAYFVVMQVLPAIFCGIPLLLGTIATLKDKYDLNDPAANKAMMDDPAVQAVSMVSILISHVIGWGFAWFMLRYLCGKQWHRKIALTRRPSSLHWSLLLLGFPAMIALSVGIDAYITRAVPSMQELLNAAKIDYDWPGIEQVLGMLRSTPLVLGLLTVAVLPAINEELWCRGFLNHGMASRYRVWIVVLLTSFLFGCLHLEPRQGIGAMFLGAAIHAAYLATRSLLVAMAVHGLNNALAVLHMNDRLGLPLLKPFEDLFEHQPVMFLSSAAVLFATVVYAFWQTRCKLVVTAEEEVRFWQPVGPASAELPPTDIPMKVAHEPLSLLATALVLLGTVQFALVVAYA